MADSDLSLQCEQYRLQIEQLRMMIREREDVIQSKDSDLKVSLKFQ